MDNQKKEGAANPAAPRRRDPWYTPDVVAMLQRKPHILSIRGVGVTEEELTLVVRCPRHGGTMYLTVPADGLRRWAEGDMIQHALPGLSRDQREQLMTGYCGPCWDRDFREPL